MLVSGLVTCQRGACNGPFGPVRVQDDALPVSVSLIFWKSTYKSPTLVLLFRMLLVVVDGEVLCRAALLTVAGVTIAPAVSVRMPLPASIVKQVPGAPQAARLSAPVAVTVRSLLLVTHVLLIVTLLAESVVAAVC